MSRSEALARIVAQVRESRRLSHCGAYCRTDDLVELLANECISETQAVIDRYRNRREQYRAAIARNDGTIEDLVLIDLTYGDVKEHRGTISQLLQCVADAAAERIRERSDRSAV